MYLYSPGNEKTKQMKAKERQIRSVEYLRQTLLLIFDLVDALDDDMFKREACSIFHGVSFYELKQFVNRPLSDIVYDAKKAVEEGLVQVPDRLSHLLPISEEEKREIKRELSKILVEHHKSA